MSLYITEGVYYASDRHKRTYYFLKVLSFRFYIYDICGLNTCPQTSPEDTFSSLYDLKTQELILRVFSSEDYSHQTTTTSNQLDRYRKLVLCSLPFCSKIYFDYIGIHA